MLKIIEHSIIQGYNEISCKSSLVIPNRVVLFYQLEAKLDRIPHLHFARYHLRFPDKEPSGYSVLGEITL